MREKREGTGEDLILEHDGITLKRYLDGNTLSTA